MAVINGTTGDDTLPGTAGNDVINADDGHDVVQGLDGNDTIWAEGGNDLLEGGDGHDNLEGGNGADTLVGGAGNDYLEGGAGDDTLVGGQGNDFLTGGSGADHFVYEVDGSSDTIADFDVAEDTIVIDGPTGLGIVHLIPFASQVGDHVVISGFGNSITIQDTNIGDLSADNFIFI